MSLFYGVRHFHPSKPKEKGLTVRSSGSCFGSFSGCFDAGNDRQYDRRMFFSTSATREQFNLYARGMRDYLKDGFTFEYKENQSSTGKPLVRHFDRPTIGFYENNSNAKGCYPEFAGKIQGKNYVSFTIPDGASAGEAYPMIKVMLKFLTVPHPTPNHFDTFKEAYEVSGNWMAAMIVCSEKGCMGGYSFPFRFGTALVDKGVLQEFLMLKNGYVLKDHQVISEWAGGTQKQYAQRDFSLPLSDDEKKLGGNANSLVGRVITTAPRCTPNFNPTGIVRGSREVVDGQMFVALHTVTKMAEYLKGVSQGVF